MRDSSGCGSMPTTAAICRCGRRRSCPGSTCGSSAVPFRSCGQLSQPLAQLRDPVSGLLAARQIGGSPVRPKVVVSENVGTARPASPRVDRRGRGIYRVESEFPPRKRDEWEPALAALEKRIESLPPVRSTSCRCAADRAAHRHPDGETLDTIATSTTSGPAGLLAIYNDRARHHARGPASCSRSPSASRSAPSAASARHRAQHRDRSSSGGCACAERGEAARSVAGDPERAHLLGQRARGARPSGARARRSSSRGPPGARRPRRRGTRARARTRTR